MFWRFNSITLLGLVARIRMSLTARDHVNFACKLTRTCIVTSVPVAAQGRTISSSPKVTTKMVLRCLLARQEFSQSLPHTCYIALQYDEFALVLILEIFYQHEI